MTRSDLEKLRGLVTFGSPLDKVYYFYREHVASDQAVRAQILSFLYSLLRARSGRDYGRFTFTYPKPPKIGERPADEPFTFPQLGDDFQWVNVWSPMDPVSGRLRFYRLDEKDRYRRLGPRYLVWGFAHLAYWGGPEGGDHRAEQEPGIIPGRPFAAAPGSAGRGATGQAGPSRSSPCPGRPARRTGG